MALVVGGGAGSFIAAQETVLPNGAQWRWRKGTNEVSDPNTLWRGAGFNDATWPLGNAPFHYNEALAGGTLLNDMSNRYTCIFLRRPFEITNVAEITAVRFVANYDDGFIAWINGTLVARTNVASTAPAYSNLASASHEGVLADTLPIANLPASYLQTGTNWLAVQAFNQSLNNSDFRFDTRLEITKTNASLPTLATISPTPGATLSTLTQITLTFSELVSGVAAQNLLINEQPASVVSGPAGTDQYTFTFTQPRPGPVTLSWEETTTITDQAGGPFDPAAPGHTWTYTLEDHDPPQISLATPVPGATIAQFTQTELHFHEPVLGLDAADLLINGQPATGLTGIEAGPYIFSFPQPAAGTVNITWAGGHGINDHAANPFPGGSWSVTLDPGLVPGDIIINEFLAASLAGMLDEDGEAQDWIELHHRGTNPVNLLGWSLTDDPAVPGKWVFPNRTLQPGEYLVIFASAKDRPAPLGGNRCHTNFKLNNHGEYLALFNAESPRVAVTQFTPEFPEQRNDYSYGRSTADQWRYFQPPTPGDPNGNSAIEGVWPPPHFSVGPGLFDAPFHVVLSVSAAGATLRYTTDGSEPTADHGLEYTGPIPIHTTTLLRAAALGGNRLPSTTATRTYLFPDHVPAQPADPPGFPATWGNYTGFPDNIVPADYELDPEIVNHPDDGPQLQSALGALPVVSIVMNVNDLFGPVNGIYTHPNPPAAQRFLWERPCSVEYIPPNGRDGFQINCGIRIQGNASREPHKTPKHPFRLLFKGDFGPGRLEYPLYPDSPVESFNSLVLRADFNNSWLHWLPAQRQRGTRTRDAWVKESWRDMGQPGGHTQYFHLYLNGLYWGVYDFGERIDAAFAANYFGGEPEEYDAIASKPLEAIDGNLVAYNAMLAAVRYTDMSVLANYNLAPQHLDLPTFIDYMLLNFYGGNEDWGVDGNWNAVRRRAPGGTFRYIPWDGELLVTTTNINRVTSTDLPSGLHPNLVNSAEYRLAFADRAHKHLFHNGALSTNAVRQRWLGLAAQVDSAVIAESARWGDYRRDVHQYQTGPYLLHTRNDFWLPEINRVANEYFPTRGNVFLQQLRNAGLYPNVTAPSFSQHGGSVPAGFLLAMSAPAGTVYYTTNGVDPRVYGTGTVSPHALSYTGAVRLEISAAVKARVWSGSAWSALNEASFTVAQIGLPLAITEIMYNPPGGDAYEFLELQNFGAMPLDLSGFSFQGISFIFPSGTTLHPGAVLLLANNAGPGLFAVRYPSAVVSGYFGGNLSNGGERIAILDGNGNTVIAVHYDDEDGWPAAPDGGGGFSLEIIDPRGDPNAPANWRASSAVNGTPGLPPVAPPLGDIVINEVAADNAGSVTNDGAFPDWIELQNRSGDAANLAAWSLTDDSDARKYVFPAGASIPAGGFLVLWCDSATNSPGLHAGFALGRNGETVSLFDVDADRVDALTFGLQLTDYSVGRAAPDGPVAEVWQLTTPTPGAANVPAALAATTSLAINEWLADPSAGGQDWLELFNRSAAAPVALRGLHLGTSNAWFRLGTLSFLAPRGFVQLFAEELPGANQLEFKLPAAGGAIVLASESGVEFQRVAYGTQIVGISEGRLPDGEATITAFPGSGSPGSTNYVLAWTGPVLNEVLARNDRAALAPWGNYADFVELYNPGGSVSNLAGFALGRSLDRGDAWSFPSGVSIPAGGQLLIWCDAARAASSGAGGALNAGFSLSGESGVVALFNPTGQPVSVISYGFQLEDKSIGRSGGVWRLLATPSPGAANAAPAALGSVASLRFNEWMADPLAGDDWFELYNSDPLPVELSGLFPSDSPAVASVTNSPIAPLSFIGGNRWVLFQADGNPGNGGEHANFSLNLLGESLRLYDTNRELIDVVDFGLQVAGVSQGRLPDGAGGIVDFATAPSPGEANFLPLPGMVINEVLSHTDPPLEDAVELFNASGGDVDIGGWYLSDSLGDLKRYRIADGTLLPAGGFKVFYQDQFGPADGESDSPPWFTFNSAHGDGVYLSQADAGGNLSGYRAGISFDAALNGVSFGRYQTSVGVDFVALSQRTFGVDNPASVAQFRTGTGLPNAYPRVGPVVINQIMYGPPSFGTNSPNDEEFIELLNLTESPVPLFDPAHPTNVWRLANAVSFDFPAHTTIPANGRLVVVPFDPVTETAALAAFQACYGTGGTLIGPYAGQLNNAGESIELWQPDQPQTGPSDAGFVPQVLVERVTYSDSAPWPTNADGGGAALQRIVAANYGNDPMNWHAATPNFGNPDNLPPTGSASLPGGGIVRLTFSVQTGRTYQVQYKTNLTDSEWRPLGVPIQASNPSLIKDDNLTGPSRFYRLSAQP